MKLLKKYAFLATCCITASAFGMQKQDNQGLKQKYDMVLNTINKEISLSTTPYIAITNHCGLPIELVEFNRVVGSKNQPIIHNLVAATSVMIHEKNCEWCYELYFNHPEKGRLHIISINKPGIYVIDQNIIQGSIENNIQDRFLVDIHYRQNTLAQNALYGTFYCNKTGGYTFDKEDSDVEINLPRDDQRDDSDLLDVNILNIETLSKKYGL